MANRITSDNNYIGIPKFPDETQPKRGRRVGIVKGKGKAIGLRKRRRSTSDGQLYIRG